MYNNIKKYAEYLVIFLIFIVSSCANNKPKDGFYHFEIFATNDLHGRLFDSLYTESATNQYSLSSVSSFINEARKKVGENSVVLLDIGDHLQGDNSVFYYNYIDTNDVHIFSKVVNFLKYDAVVVGNHDIEAGHPVYDKINKEIKPPYLAANAIDIELNKPYFKPYTIIEREGIRIAVIGMTNPNIKKWLSPDLWRGLSFEEIIPSLENIVKEIREKETPHLIVAAIHAGLGDEDEYEMENPAKYVAKHVKGIDIVFAAHDHKTFIGKLYNGLDSVLILEGGSRASSLSCANIDIEIKDGLIVSKRLTPENISMKDVLPDSNYDRQFRAEFLAVKKFTTKIVGHLENTISSRDAFFGPSEYIDMIHTLQLENSKADVSFTAPLSLDVTIEAGDLNFQDLLNLYPFENQLYVIRMTGKEIKNYLEFSYSKWINIMHSPDDKLLLFDNQGKEGRIRLKNLNFNFDSAGGIIYEVDVRKGYGERIKILSMANGSIFSNDSTYKVALSSYRANGGGDLLEKGAMIPKNELESRVISRLSDIRGQIYTKIKENGSIKGERLNQWKFVPEDLVKKAAKRDYNTLFNK